MKDEMNKDDRKQQKTQARSKMLKHLVCGRLTAADGIGAVFKNYRVEARFGDRRLAKTYTDDSGRFLLEWSLPDKGTIAVDVIVFMPQGMTLGHARLSSEDLLFPKELIFHAPQAITADAPFEIVPTQPDREPLIAPESFELLYEVIIKAIEEGHLEPQHGLFSETAWIHLAVTELQQLEDLVSEVIQGVPTSIDALRDMLRRAPRWSSEQGRSLPEPGQHGVPDCFLRPMDPYILVGSGFLLDRLDWEGNRLDWEGKSGPWLERAMGFYLSKSAPIEGLFHAAEHVLRGEMEIPEFAEFFTSAKPPSLPHHMPADQNMPDSTAAHPGQPTDPGLPFGPEKWDPCTLNWGHCTGVLGVIVEGEISSSDVPIMIGRVDPSAVCRGYSGTLTLYPVIVGGQFPMPQPQYGPNEGLALSVGGQTFPLTVTPGGWTATSITVNFPQGAASGCAVIYWQSPTASLPARLAGSHDCNNLLGITPRQVITKQPQLSIGRPRLAIGGAQIRYFQADGQSGIVADACTDVRLRWDVSAGVCSATGPGSAKVTLSAGKQAVLANAPLKGELTVKGRNTITYTLTVESFAGATSCGVTTATVTISRVSRIFLSVPDRVFHPSRTIPVTVRISCPAPVGGQPVDLLSSDLTTLPNTSVIIAEGNTETTVQLGPPMTPVRVVKLTATTQGYVGASVDLMIHFSSCVPPSFTANQPRYGGKWDTGPTIPGVVGIHLAVLHTGKVLLFAYDEGPNPQDLTPKGIMATSLAIGDSNKAQCAVWDPKSGAITNVALTRNLFCSGHCFLEDGQLFVAGGQFPVPVIAGGAHRDLHLFDPASETWSRIQPDMTKGRWYPSCVTLPNGDAMVISGNDAYFGGPNGTQNTLQIFDHTTKQIGPVTNLPFNIYHLYPFTHVVPSGAVFAHWRRTTGLYTPATDTWLPTAWPEFAFWPTPTGNTQYQFSRTGPGPGTSVLLPLIPKRDPQTNNITYPAGQIMILGGGGAEGEPDPKFPGEVYKDANDVDLLNFGTLATDTAEILDLNERYPQQWRSTGRMTQGRVMPDSVLLPDGKVLVVGGANRGRSGGFLIHFGATWGATNHANEPEIFDPQTKTWETMCPGGRTRLYHATAALLPDGRVVIAGHDGFLNISPFQTSQYTLDIFSPPYLDSSRGPRPRILYSPGGTVSYNNVFYIDTDDSQAVASVALVRQSSVTHQTNTDQRYVRLAIVSIADSKRIYLKVPPNTVAPPGYYMLFIVNQAGVPSVANWVRLG